MASSNDNRFQRDAWHVERLHQGSTENKCVVKLLQFVNNTSKPLTKTHILHFAKCLCGADKIAFGHRCSRCKRQKIKCSGQQPCANCARRNLACIVNESEFKVVVTKGYLSAMQAKIEQLERCRVRGSSSDLSQVSTNDNVRGNHAFSLVQASIPPDASSSSAARDEDAVPDAPILSNPLSITAASRYMSSSKGLRSYLGTSSNWSFHGRILNLVHTQIHRTPFPPTEFLFEGEAYGLPWKTCGDTSLHHQPSIPSFDHAVFLLNAVKFHCMQVLHLFEAEEFETQMQMFYHNTGATPVAQDLWYIHFLAIMALGKALVRQRHQDLRPPGADLFQKAQKLLPDTDILCREPIVAMEILCCLALYLHALDSRNAAHVTIGQAMRIAQANGMHTDMPTQELGGPLVQRCRQIWWTVCLLDRQMTSLMGIPQSIRTDEITCKLPDLTQSPQRRAALEMQIKISHAYADIGRTVYGPQTQPKKEFVTNIKAVLDTLAALAAELRNKLSIQTHQGMSRLSAHLHLQHLQMVLLVIRPILFCCLERTLQAPTEASRLIASNKVRQIISLSSETALNMLNMLEGLKEQGLLETFLPWDFEALFVTTSTLILIGVIDSTLLPEDTSHTEKIPVLFEYMIACGNDVAAHRDKELRWLKTMLEEHTATTLHQGQNDRRSGIESTGTASRVSQAVATLQEGVPAKGTTSVEDSPGHVIGLQEPFVGSSYDGIGFGQDLTADQVLFLAESMDIEEIDWMNLVMSDVEGPWGN